MAFHSQDQDEGSVQMRHRKQKSALKPARGTPLGHVASVDGVPQSLLKFITVESVMPSSHLVLCRPLLLLPPIPPSIRVFSNELGKYWSFRISPSNECSGLISFRIDWFDLFAVQGTFRTFSTTV